MPWDKKGGGWCWECFMYHSSNRPKHHPGESYNGFPFNFKYGAFWCDETWKWVI